ncbi:MAG: hypothetical protein CMF96_08785 [Candidatus Marinimicrobia bacterium]|nr:hypothetical protein [Candidatus Neomarinimicrobiota bacterium]|tara:strand:+ start:14 stop:637 length:624 start_codon:yes stop_codon:yes gene_type:complete
MMKNQKYFYNGFTLVEMISIILISSISFLGMFYIFADISKKLDNDLIRSEIKTYCNYSLDEMSKYIKMADDISFNTYDQNIQLITDGNLYGRNSFSLSRDNGILINGEAIHESKSTDINNNPIKNHVIRYTSVEKSGFIRYNIQNWDIYTKPNTDGTTTNENSNVRESTIIIEISVNLVMGWDDEKIIEKLNFKKETFSPTYFIGNS